MQRFRAEQWLPYPVEFVFAFFANPANLPKLFPAWQNARIDDVELHPATGNPLTGSPAAGSGTVLGLSFRPFPFSPVRLSWVSVIEHFHWNDRFCDRQLRGPFRYWRHCHRVVPHEWEHSGEHGTLLIDTIEYQLRPGTLGLIAQHVAERKIARLFVHRRRQIAELLRQLNEDAALRE